VEEVFGLDKGSDARHGLNPRVFHGHRKSYDPPEGVPAQVDLFRIDPLLALREGDRRPGIFFFPLPSSNLPPFIIFKSYPQITLMHRAKLHENCVNELPLVKVRKIPVRLRHVEHTIYCFLAK
jgi:hypothetical protein